MIATLGRTGRVFVSAMWQRRVPYWPADRLYEAQNRRVRRMIRHAFETVPFYRSVMRERKLTPDDFQTAQDLARLPLIDKVIVRENIAAFASSDFVTADCIPLHSGSGASTYWDPKSALHRVPIAERDRVVWTKILRKPLGMRQLFILAPSSSSLRSRAFYDTRIRIPRLFIQRFYLDPTEPYQAAIDMMNRVQPDIVYSYGSYLEHFARYVRTTGLSVRAPRIWAYGADALTSHWRDLIQQELGCRVFSNYSSTEAGRMGFECEDQCGYHLNVDCTPLRIIRPDGADCQPGEVGEVVVSNLINRATVLLNYRIGDLGEISDRPCSCKRTLPLLKTLHGRVSETVVLVDGEELPSTALLGTFAVELEHALEVQVASPRPGQIHWRIVPSIQMDQHAFRARLLSRCNEVFAGRALAEVEFVTDIPRLPGGKFQTIVPHHQAVPPHLGSAPR